MRLIDYAPSIPQQTVRAIEGIRGKGIISDSDLEKIVRHAEYGRALGAAIEAGQVEAYLRAFDFDSIVDVKVPLPRHAIAISVF